MPDAPPTYLPACDFCPDAMTPARFEAPVRSGPWANLCHPHLSEHGIAEAARRLHGEPSP